MVPASFLTPAVFLDRDGVLNVDRSDYIKCPEEYVPIPGAAEAVAQLKQAGWVVVVVSNQSGLGRGLFGQEALDATMAKMHSVLAQAGASVDAVYYCPHAPDAACDCRKPKPGLLIRAAQELDLDLPRSFLVGDKRSDIDLGRRAGMRTVLVETGLPKERPDSAAVGLDHTTRDLAAAVAWILQQKDR